MWKQLIIWGSLFLLLIVMMGCFSLPSVEEVWFTKNFINNSSVIKSLLSVFILFFVAYFLFIGVLLKKYSLKIEQLNFGGINILFNNSDALFIKSVMNYLDTKRTLFNYSKEYDSLEETLNSFFEVYVFIRTEMKILHPRRDASLYLIANEMLRTLNKFLTTHQNNYRRWHKFVSEHDSITIDVDGTETLVKYHQTAIGDLQKHYYKYNDIINDIQKLNEYFNGKVRDTFNIDTAKWSW